MQLAQPRVRLVAAQPRLATQPRSGARHCQRAARLLPRAQQQGGGEAAEAAAEAAAAVAEQQAAAQAYQSAAEAAQEEVEELKAAAVAHTAEAASVSAEQRAAYQAAPTPEPPAPRRAGLPLNLLQHPAVRVAGISAAVFLGGTFLLTLWRTSRDPQKRRKSTVNKNKLVVDTSSKFLPGNRAAMTGGSFSLLRMQTGFSNVEIFRKYLWFLLRERSFDEEALADLVALKAALGLSDEQVAEALRERAQRVYEKYGTVMVNMQGMSQSGVERKAAARNLFIKLLSLTEARALLSGEAAAGVDLGRVFGVTQRDILTLRSGYSAEGDEGQGAPGDAATDDEDEGGAAA